MDYTFQSYQNLSSFFYFTCLFHKREHLDPWLKLEHLLGSKPKYEQNGFLFET
jgi:hypothetical protein